MFSCPHFDTSSDRLFSVADFNYMKFFLLSINDIFCLNCGRGAFAMIGHLVVMLVLLSLSCQMYFDSSVLLESFLWVNVDLR